MFLLPADYYKTVKTKKKGRGVFARKEIPGGTLVGDYLGKIIRDSEIDALEKKYGGASYSMDYTGDDTSIFPAVKTSGVHLINHSCAPNCDVYYYFGHTLYFALRRIFPGEELTVDYGFDPQSDNAVSYCLCGSPFCRGTMYASPEKLEKFHVFFQQQIKGQRFKICRPGTFLEPLAKYPKRIKDFSCYDLFADLEVRPEFYDDNKLPNISELRQRLRNTGRRLKFRRLGFTILGIVDGRLIIEKR
ncbi:MAG: SET domain-containing protein-lysine N-methyltransferase [Patescibacteria group bacterium]